jgi:hypothetical protein
VAGLPSMFVPFFSKAGTSLEFCSGRLHCDMDNGRNKRGRISKDLEFNMTKLDALDRPIAPRNLRASSSHDGSQDFDLGFAPAYRNRDWWLSATS